MLIGMEWEKDSYHHAVAIEGDSAWQHVVLSPSDFRNREGEVLKDWDGLDITITPTGALEWSDLKLRNLKWTESDQLGERR